MNSENPANDSQNKPQLPEKEDSAKQPSSLEQNEAETESSKDDQFKQIAAVEDVNELMYVVSGKEWVVLWCVIFVIICVIFWSFFGSMVVIVQGRAIAVTHRGPRIVSSKQNGTVVDILYSTLDQKVPKDAIIMRLEDPELDLSISQHQENLAIEEAVLLDIRNEIEQKIASRNDGITKQIQAAQFAIDLSNSQLIFLRSDLESKQRLFKQGILPQSQVEETITSIDRLKIDIENQQVLIDIGRNQLKEPLGRDQIKAQEMRVMAVKDILENLALQKSFLEIKSPFTGIIIDMQAAKGESIKAGNPICVMERFDPGTKIWFYATFGSGAGKLLHEGSKVELELDSVDAKEYGYLLGSVRRISTFPVSDSQLISVVKIPQIVQFLKQGQAVNYEVEIDLLLDPLTQSGFKWTTAEGPPIKIETGTTAIIRGIIVEKHPIYYLLPGRY